MANDRIVRIVLAGDSSGAVRALRSVDDASASTTKDLEEHSERQQRSFERVGSKIGEVSKMAVLAGAVGIGALADGIARTTKAGMGLQSQQALLANSLKNTGIYSARTMSQLSSLAATMSTRGGFGAQENIQSLTQLTRVTGNATQATKLFGLATDVARGSHKDLLQVTKALALAEQGRTTGLSRLGIALPAGTSPATMMQILQQRFGGATAAYSKTAAGSLGNLGQSFDVMKEDLGRAFLPLVTMLSRTLTGLMPMITRTFGAIAKPLSSTLEKLLPPLLNALVKILPPVLSVVNTLIPPIARVLSTMMPIVTGAINQLLPIFQQALNTLVPLVSTVLTVWVREFAVFVPPILKLLSQVMPILTHALQTYMPPLISAFGVVVTALEPVISKLITTLAPLFPVLANAIAQIIPPLARGIAAMMPALTQAITLLLPPFVKAFDLLVPPLTTALVRLMPAITLLANATKSIMGAVHLRSNGTLHVGGHGVLSDIANFAFNPFGRFNAQHHATGGIIGGYGGTDSQLSWMTPGEGVLTPPAVQAIGGQSGLNTLNATGHLNGNQLPDRDIVINIRPQIGQRIFAEEVVRYSLRKVALS